MDERMCFVAVEFENDPNVRGYIYWYLCPDRSVQFGNYVIAPLGRHNNLQKGVVRHVKFADEDGAPFPLHLIKTVKEVVRS